MRIQIRTRVAFFPQKTLVIKLRKLALAKKARQYIPYSIGLSQPHFAICIMLDMLLLSGQHKTFRPSGQASLTQPPLPLRTGRIFVLFFVFDVTLRWKCTVIRFMSKFGICTVGGLYGTLVEARNVHFHLKCTHFIFNKCPRRCKCQIYHQLSRNGLQCALAQR